MQVKQQVTYLRIFYEQIAEQIQKGWVRIEGQLEKQKDHLKNYDCPHP